MSKMFYSVEETAQKLGKSEDEVRQMASSGALEEFREGSDLVFKAEQVDLLADDDDEELSLDLDGGLDLADSSTGASSMGLADSEIDLGESALDLSSSGLAGESAIPVDADSSGDAGDASSAGSAAGGSAFDLAESDMDLTLADSGAASGASFDLGESEESDDENPMEQTGVSIFADDGDEADPSAATFVADGAPAIDLNADQLEGVGSGSGLLDLTQEGDDTSLGVDLLDDGFGGGDASAMGAAVQSDDEGGLFESTEVAGGDDMAAGAVMAQPMVAYDGGGSGLVLGLSVGAAVAVLFAGSLTILSTAGVGASTVIDSIGGEWWIPAAALGGITLIGGVLGFVLMKKGG